MTKEADWERLADPQMISARYMVMLAVFIEIIVQTFALIVQPTAWWTWQLLGFITATNLAAVILAIMAQKTANDIGASTKLAFTPSFYKTMTLLSKFQEYFEEEAAKGGRDMNEEMEGYDVQISFDEHLEDLKLFDFREYGPGPKEFQSELSRNRLEVAGFKLINTNTINNLSAIGSKISPKTDSEFVFLAKYPSKKSEIEAIIKNKNATQ